MEENSAHRHNAIMRKVVEKLIPDASRPDRVGHRITAIRQTLGMTKAELAQSIGLDPSTLTKVEKGKAGLDIAMGAIIATQYGYGLDFIYLGDLSDVPLELRPRLVQNLRIAENSL